MCIIEGCDRADIVGYGMCNKHYLHNKRYGTPYTHTTPYGLCKDNPREWNSYRSMKNRCLCKTDKNYPRWGGKGIKICDRWLGPDGFCNFLNDMGRRPEGATLDRINNSLGYSPENCRWADMWQQRANTDRMKGRNPGVYQEKRSNSWVANITVKDKGIRKTRTFKAKEDAVAQRKQWEREFLVSFCHEDRQENQAPPEES